jgi:hypothetical protein
MRQKVFGSARIFHERDDPIPNPPPPPLTDDQNFWREREERILLDALFFSDFCAAVSKKGRKGTGRGA